MWLEARFQGRSANDLRSEVDVHEVVGLESFRRLDAKAIAFAQRSLAW